MYGCFKQKPILNVSTIFIFSKGQLLLGKNYQKQSLNQFNNMPIKIPVINATDDLTKLGRKQNFLNWNQFHNSEVLPFLFPLGRSPSAVRGHRPQSYFAMLHVQHHRWNNRRCIWSSFTRLGHVSPICHRAKVISAPPGSLQSIVNAQLLSWAFFLLISLWQKLTFPSGIEGH